MGQIASALGAAGGQNIFQQLGSFGNFMQAQQQRQQQAPQFPGISGQSLVGQASGPQFQTQPTNMAQGGRAFAQRAQQAPIPAGQVGSSIQDAQNFEQAQLAKAQQNLGRIRQQAAGPRGRSMFRSSAERFGGFGF